MHSARERATAKSVRTPLSKTQSTIISAYVQFPPRRNGVWTRDGSNRRWLAAAAAAAAADVVTNATSALSGRRNNEK